ncbi:1,4-dihydroxy-2-naphthoate octaprenyltransferase [Pseudothauera nasutitermitis]|uniref:1,4-dihydroxy-2-naphthoate octaprenyltransferase n=1 Tax=Pseudothauera nasutitermitis TaxID=2565930 RepID=A0A4S4B3T3_9RHOO|nr:1,4-dihydroxy-2-naphthoate octaprenyltransferase [Pseudothauera nasutitermitis]THF67348.1 1,4-dihydroxy-2-naphthoate octaprenyltransferase [Pseudothauera nasutitermitis]
MHTLRQTFPLSRSSPQRHAAPRVWWAAIRPRTLGIAVAPVMVGTALAVADGAALDWLVLLAALGSAVLIQIGTNLYNDAADFERGTDGPRRVGPLRVTAAGLASATAVKRGAWLSFAAALALGGYLVAVGGPFILAIGIASLLAGWAYSGGPRPISHTPLGECFVLVFFGVLAVCGSHWLQAQALSAAAVVAGLAAGAPAAAVLLVNNYRDLDTDLLSGRRTLAALLGRVGCLRAYGLLVLLPLPLLGVLALAGHPGALLGLLCAPALLRLAGRFRAASGPGFNAVLTDTARQGSLLGLSMAAGLLLQSVL